MLLLGVEIMGDIGKGAQRWIDIGILQLQPSELMKIALVLALARYFHGLDLEQVRRPAYVIVPVLMILLPVGLVLKQPDLGTAVLLLLGIAKGEPTARLAHPLGLSHKHLHALGRWLQANSNHTPRSM